MVAPFSFLEGKHFLDIWPLNMELTVSIRSLIIVIVVFLIVARVCCWPCIVVIKDDRQKRSASKLAKKVVANSDGKIQEK